jgi:hypothetical protein
MGIAPGSGLVFSSAFPTVMTLPSGGRETKLAPASPCVLDQTVTRRPASCADSDGHQQDHPRRMPHNTPLIATIVAGLSLAFILGALAQRLKVSPIAGFCSRAYWLDPTRQGLLPMRHSRLS